MKKSLMLGAESIAFQSGVLFGELTGVCQEIHDLVNESKPDRELADSKLKQLAAIINHHTGLKPRVEFNDFGPAVLVPDLLKNHALREMALRDYVSGGETLSAIASNGGPLKGTVSLLNSRVTGFFSEIQFPIYIPMNMFVKTYNFTAAEIAAIILHEVGHVFTFMEYINRGVTTNVILSILNKSWLSKDVKEREIILMNASQALQLKNGEIDVAELSQSSKFEIVETVIATAVLEQTRSELGGSEYDLVNFEYLSDEFATRHGGGRDIVTALDKLSRLSSSEMAYRSLPTYIRTEILKILMLPFPVLNIMAIILVVADHESSNDVYDKAPDRYRRVRNQLLERLKIKDIPKEHRDQLLQDISVVDDIIAKLNDRRQLFTLLVEKVLTFTSVAKRRKQLVLQRELEALAFNNLFIKSAELDNL